MAPICGALTPGRGARNGNTFPRGHIAVNARPDVSHASDTEFLKSAPAREDGQFFSSTVTCSHLGENPSREKEEGTPEERIEEAFEDHNTALMSDIKERVQALDDEQFERLIVKLMLGLGYGASGSGKRTGGRGDGAVDGVITEDVLGLDKIYLQAKSYGPGSAISLDTIREFAGAMDAHGILKGVFVTTSRYTKAAHDYAERSHKHLRLINGDELAKIMVEHGIGVRGYRKLELKNVDSDFFEALYG